MTDDFDVAVRRIGRKRAIKFFAVRVMLALLLIALAIRFATGA